MRTAGIYRGQAEYLVRQVQLSRLVRLARRALLNATSPAAAGRGGGGGKVRGKARGEAGRSGMLMKLDIEGAEWTVLPDLMASHALCALARAAGLHTDHARQPLWGSHTASGLHRRPVVGRGRGRPQ